MSENSTEAEPRTDDRSDTGSSLSTGVKVATAVGVTAAVVALAAVVRKRTSGGKRTVFHLEPDDEGWCLTIEGEGKVEARFDTKEDGLEAARELAHQASPSELVIHRADGSEQDRHRYEHG